MIKSRKPTEIHRVLAMLNPKSEIRNLGNPLAAVGNKDWQFFHHELGLANGANHGEANGGVPFFRHFFPGVAAPALDVGTTSENMTVDFS